MSRQRRKVSGFTSDWDLPGKEDFLVKCQEILDIIEEADEELKDRSDGFFGGVEDKTMAIMESVDGGAPVTQGRVDAIANMRRGIEKWLENE